MARIQPQFHSSILKYIRKMQNFTFIITMRCESSTNDGTFKLLFLRPTFSDAWPKSVRLNAEPSRRQMILMGEKPQRARTASINKLNSTSSQLHLPFSFYLSSAAATYPRCRDSCAQLHDSSRPRLRDPQEMPSNRPPDFQPLCKAEDTQRRAE